MYKVNAQEFIKANTITDKDNIRKALCMPKSFPEKLLTPLVPDGIAKFKGDKLPRPWSVNQHFNVGENYPLYFRETEFVVSPVNGQGMKLTEGVWSVKTF